MAEQYRRADRVAELIHQEMCRILLRQIGDPRLRQVTITRIRLSADLRCAKIYVSMLGDEEQISQTLKGLERAKRFIRGELGRNLKLRYTPELIFKWDGSLADSIHISQVLEELKGRGELG